MLGTSRNCVSKLEATAVVGSESASCGTSSLEIAKSLSENMPVATASVHGCTCEGEDCNKAMICPCAPKGGMLTLLKPQTNILLGLILS